MKHPFGPTLAAVVVVGIASVCGAPAMAQSSTSLRQENARQHRVILEQQRQLKAYQQQLAARGQPQAAQDDRGFLDKLYCPRGYSLGGAHGECYPNLPAPVAIVPAR